MVIRSPVFASSDGISIGVVGVEYAALDSIDNDRVIGLTKVSLTSTSQPGMVKELLRTLTDVPVFFSVTEMPDRV